MTETIGETPMPFDHELATGVIHQVFRNLKLNPDDDLIQAGQLECLESWRKYNPHLSAPSTFFYMAARRGIIYELRQRNHFELRPQRNFEQNAGIVGSLQDEVPNGTGTADFGDLLPSEEILTEIQAEETAVKTDLQKALDSPILDDRERSVVAMYYTQELTQREIGDKLHITESRVNQILREIQRKLRLSLNDWK